jgi:hypothetical protein
VATTTTENRSREIRPGLTPELALMGQWNSGWRQSAKVLFFKVFFAVRRQENGTWWTEKMGYFVQVEGLIAWIRELTFSLVPRINSQRGGETVVGDWAGLIVPPHGIPNWIQHRPRRVVGSVRAGNLKRDQAGKA